VTGNGASHRGFRVDACVAQTTIIHHVMFSNDVVVNAAQGYDTNDCGYNTSAPGNGGDYFADVGSIAQNAAQDTGCLAAVDFVGPLTQMPAYPPSLMEYFPTTTRLPAPRTAKTSWRTRWMLMRGTATSRNSGALLYILSSKTCRNEFDGR
jgi:hypothetical protein